MTTESVNLGPLEDLFNDDGISEIMVNNFRRVFVEKQGKMLATSLKFGSEAELQELITQIAHACGRDITPQKPFFDGYLDDGSRVNAVIPPMSPSGSNLTIRRFRRTAFTMQNLIQSGSISDKAAYFLEAAIRARLNIIVSGGTGTGKTTFLNLLSSMIPADERVISIEDVAELQLQHPNWVRLESVNTIAGKSVTTKDCLFNALRMRPDRIIVGECRRDETAEMLQAMNTGHEGSLTTIHANSPRDCLTRIETMVTITIPDYPLSALRKQMVSAIDLVIQLKRAKDGTRKITEILELTGMESDTITAQQIFSRDKGKLTNLANLDPNKNELFSTGIVPKCVDRLADAGVKIPPNFFEPSSKLTFQH